MAVTSVIPFFFFQISERIKSPTAFLMYFSKIMVAIFFLVLGLVALNQTHFPPEAGVK